MRTDSDVVIVGGGPAGASAGFFLARAGVDVVILDRARFPREKPCAEYLSPQASRILSEMGMLDEVERAGAAHLCGMRVTAPDGNVIHGEFAAAHGFHGFRDHGLALRRLILDELLLRRAGAAGARVAEGVSVRDVLRDGTGRTVGVATSGGDQRTEWHAPLVIGADGLRSVVARRLHMGHYARRPRRVAFVAHYEGVAGMGPHGEMHVTPPGYVGLADVGHALTNVALVVPRDQAEKEAAGDADGFLERRLRAIPRLAPRFAHARRTTSVRAVGPFAWRARRAWAPGAALVGDAADFFDPFTGEGIYAALRGGEMLATYAIDALRAKGARGADDALAAYDRWRRHEFSGKWRVERLVGMAVAMPWLMNRAARVLGARRDLADLFVGVTGDFVPPREILRPSYLAHFLFPPRARRDSSGAPALEGRKP